MLHIGVSCAVVSVPCSLGVTWWERVDLLAVVGAVFSCILSLSQMCPSWSTSELMARLAPSTGSSLSVK